jgi:hypothetical protein
MSLPRSMGSILMLGLVLAQPSRAEPAPASNAQIEVDFLLGYIEESGCEFYRNGTWHDSKAARSHLHDKYIYLKARDLINTAEDFVGKAATQSSLTGEPYQVRCKGAASVATRQWLLEELARFRAFNKKPASILLEPRPTRASISYAANASGVSANPPWTWLFSHPS